MKRILALAAIASFSISVLSAVSSGPQSALARSADVDDGSYAARTQQDESKTYSPDEIIATYRGLQVVGVLDDVAPIVAFSGTPQYGGEAMYCYPGGSISLTCCNVYGNETGDYTDAMDPATFDALMAAGDPQLGIAIPDDQDIASIGRRARYAPVYLVRDGDAIAGCAGRRWYAADRDVVQRRLLGRCA